MRLITILAAFLILSVQTFAGGIKFHKGTWKEALAEAKAQDKLIFMDCFTTWCGPCKMMARDVFPQESVGAYFNKNFINVKMDMEKGEGKILARQYSVRAYPTLLFIDGDGKMVHSDRGAKPAGPFLGLGKAAMKKFDKSIEYAKEYKDGKKDADFLKKYAYALRRSSKPYGKITNEYLQTQKKLTTPENLKVIFDLTESVDSRIFGLMTKHKKAIIQLDDISVSDYEDKVVEAALTTVKKGVEYKTASLLKDAKKAVKKHAKGEYKSFSLKADMTYYAGVKNEKKFIKATNKYVKKFAKNNAKKLNQAAANALIVCKNPKSFKKAEKWAAKAVENGGEAAYYLTYAQILERLNKNNAALKAAKAGKKLARENRKPVGRFETLINKLKKKV